MEEGGAVNIFSFCHSIFSCYDYKPISFYPSWQPRDQRTPRFPL